ncbi:uncharacterized protein LOC131940114 [Physella acuta]|uniref:uncharacterized protein LOC131940114 n=1 Tax=Physella acuta TaxID=109671 RepID=UPI0027DB3137|nr:uncharacterized protein LOC131940114 [Physella acuta]
MSVGLDGKTQRNTLSRDIVLQQRSSTSCEKDESSVVSNTSQDTNVSSDDSSTRNVNNNNHQPNNARGRYDAKRISAVPGVSAFERVTNVTTQEADDIKQDSQLHVHTIQTTDYPRLNSNASKKSRRKISTTSLAPILPTASTKGRNSNCLLMGKTTRMLLATSVTYIVSYMTTITILLLTAVTTLLDHPTAQEDSIINFFIVFYLINSAANPIIYSICNPNFRRDCVLICTQCSIKSCKT